ncbi:RNA helicase [Giardia muris]|uniref:RNA helicase n=1 Tax=Giardia muris TaxID=5742 RepID=A0A4Z1SPX9_GIAMU|nr:RNA helicase [Giardia muris]|eukprot:TNJ26935.1 RNA helicase [Giardia muris]
MSHPLADILTPFASELSMAPDELLNAVLAILASDGEIDEVVEALLDLLPYAILDTPLIDLVRQNRAQYIEGYKATKSTVGIHLELNLPEDIGKVESSPSSTETPSLSRPLVSFLPSLMVDLMHIPHVPTLPPAKKEHLKAVIDLPPLFQEVFKGRVTHFNRLQTACYHALYETTSNILLCAPTGAGKTNCALLCILRAFQTDLVVDPPTLAPNSESDAVHLVFGDAPSGPVTVLEPAELKTEKLVVYLTPMKALASEITSTLVSMLSRLPISVLECTGDESPPAHLLQEANVLICTPEKWDVITRKPVGETSLISRQVLLILDEVHLLGVNGRGPVIESIVARTFQYSEDHQQPLRVVGISATVPNYRDVAAFLKVPDEGLLHFSSEYRPVPLAQTIIGVKPQDVVSQEKLDKLLGLVDPTSETAITLRDGYYYLDKVMAKEIVRDEVPEVFLPLIDRSTDRLLPVMRGVIETEDRMKKQLAAKTRRGLSQDDQDDDVPQKANGLKRGYTENDLLDMLAIQLVEQELSRRQTQILVFVHSRTGTVTLASRIAESLRRLIAGRKIAEPKLPNGVLRSVGASDKRELSQMLTAGVGYHTAGMPKEQRQMVEGLFRAGTLHVVCCTATLAWGVNLPCSTVIVRGTDVFTSEGAADLGVLDLQQIFGRAGRPQFTAKGEVGHGIILTSHEKTAEYARLLNNETPIESHLIDALPEILNAEVILGNASSVSDCKAFIQNTFLVQRFLQLPWRYGARMRQTADGAEVDVDATINAYTMQAIHILTASRIVTLESDGDTLFPTEVGRICSYYYVRFSSFKNFLQLLAKTASEAVSHADLLACLCSSPEFSTYSIRLGEIEELSSLSGDDLEYLMFHSADDGPRRFTRKTLDKFGNTSGKPCCRLNITAHADTDSAAYKVNTLLQCFISRREIRTQSLVTDQRMCIAIAPRLIRAFAEVAIVLKRAPEAMKLYDLVGSLEYQRWFQDALPLWAIVRVPVGTSERRRNSYSVKLEAAPRSGVSDILDEQMLAKFEKGCSAEDLPSSDSFFQLSFDKCMACFYSKDLANKFREAIRYVPRLIMTATLQPVTTRILRLNVSCTVGFKWHRAIHGDGQSFILIVHSPLTGVIVHSERILITEETCTRASDLTVIIRTGSWRKNKIGKSLRSYDDYIREIDIDPTELCMVNPDQTQQQVLSEARLIVTSFPENWAGTTHVRVSEEVTLQNVLSTSESSCKTFDDGSITFPLLNSPQALVYTATNMSYTPLPRIPPLSIRALHWPEAEAYFHRRFTYFNILQSIMFHKLYYTDASILIGCPTGSGKTTCSELAILQTLRDRPKKKILYIAPLKALIRERYNDWKNDLAKDLGLSVIEITGESLPTGSALYKADIILSTPEKFDAISRHWQWKTYIQMIALIIFDELHLVGTTRGYVLEAIVCRMRYLSKLVNQETSFHTRFIGLSTVSANTADIARWLGIRSLSDVFNFHPAARPVKLEAHIQGYPGWHYSPRMNTMNRPIYKAIRQYSPRLPVLVFTASRRQTRRTAKALITFAQMDTGHPPSILTEPRTELCYDVEDEDCREALLYGIGLHHAGMIASDRSIVERLYLQGRISIIIATSTLAWGLNLPAYMTVIKGCEYFDGTVSRYVDYDTTDIMQMAGRAGRPQYVMDRLRDKFITSIFDAEAYEYLNTKGLLDAAYIMSSGGVIPNQPVIVDALVTFYSKRPSFEAIPREVIVEALDGLQRQLLEEPQSVCVVMCKSGMKAFYKSFFTEPFPFESSLLSSTNTSPVVAAMLKTHRVRIKHSESHFPDVLNAEIASFGSRTLFELKTWLQGSFYFVRARRNPLFYQIHVVPLLKSLQKLLGDMEEENTPEITSSLMKLEASFRLYLGITSADDKRLVSRKSLPIFADGPVLLLKLAQPNELQDFLIVSEITNHLEDALMTLEDSGMITHKRKGGVEFTDLGTKVHNIAYKPTHLGDVISRYYIAYKSGMGLYDWLREEGRTPATFLNVLIRCEEFQAVPMRHNEDRDSKLLMERFLWDQKESFIGGKIRYPIDEDIPNTEPSYKTFILLQNQLIRSSSVGPFDLPVIDYWIDLGTILDSAIRLTIALAEAAFLTHLHIVAVKDVICFSQAFVQGLWPDLDSRLCLTPIRRFLGQKKERVLNKLGLHTIQDFVTLFHSQGSKAFRQYVKDNLYSLSTNEVETLERELLAYPNMHFEIIVKRISTDKAPIDVSIYVSFNHVSVIPESPLPRQYSGTAYTKSKPHTWFLALTNPSGDIIDFKRLSGVPTGGSYCFSVAYESSFTVHALPDCFLGLDREVFLDLTELKPNDTLHFRSEMTPLATSHSRRPGRAGGRK